MAVPAPKCGKGGSGASRASDKKPPRASPKKRLGGNLSLSAFESSGVDTGETTAKRRKGSQRVRAAAARAHPPKNPFGDANSAVWREPCADSSLNESLESQEQPSPPQRQPREAGQLQEEQHPSSLERSTPFSEHAAAAPEEQGEAGQRALTTEQSLDMAGRFRASGALRERARSPVEPREGGAVRCSGRFASKVWGLPPGSAAAELDRRDEDEDRRDEARGGGCREHDATGMRDGIALRGGAAAASPDQMVNALLQGCPTSLASENAPWARNAFTFCHLVPCSR